MRHVPAREGRDPAESSRPQPHAAAALAEPQVLALQRTAGNAAVARWLALGASTGPRVQRQVVPVTAEDKAPSDHQFKSTLDGKTFRTREEGEQHERRVVREERELKFGLALRGRMEMLLAKVKFGAAADWYDPEFWEPDATDEDALVLKPGRAPSEAITQLHSYSAAKEGYEGKESAKLDCVEIIEVARWLAELDVEGKKAFDEKYGNGKPFRLAAPGSTGIEGETLAVRVGGASDDVYDSAGGPVSGQMRVQAGEHVRVVELAEYLPTVPIGSRVMWRNFDIAVSKDDDFKNENTVKIAPDLYAAHPFGVFPLAGVADQIAEGGFSDVRELLRGIAERAAANEGKPLARPDAIKRKYYEGVDSKQAYIEKFVRIVEIETFGSQV